MYKVFSRKGAGSVVVEALLEEAGVPHEVEIVERDAEWKFPASFIKINPMAQVPVLILPDGDIMTESAAICIHLADQFPETGLAPAMNDRSRPQYLRWMVFLAANIYMTDLRLYYPARYVDREAAAEAVKNAAAQRMAEEWEIYAAALGDKTFILGDRMSAVDIYAAMLATWNLDVPSFFAKHPNVKRMYDAVIARPAISRVWERNEM